jgi:uncharacterized protein (TIGR02996 family)
MLTPQAAVDQALAQAPHDASAATRELLLDLFEGKRLAQEQQQALSAIAECATAIRWTTIAATHGAAIDLGDNWMQCPHCADVFEGEASACKACGKPIAVARQAIEIALGGATLWLCPAQPVEPVTAASLQRDPRVVRVAWLRVEAGPRWFELLDEAARAAAGDTLPFTVSLPPNVSAVGTRDAQGEGECTLLVHASKHDVHVVERGVARTDGDRKNATELAVRELTRVVFPDGPPAPPSGQALAQKGHARNPDLEAAIAGEPDRLETYLVYADWLQNQGDPRGELIALQQADQVEAANRLLETHAAHFYGRLANTRYLLEAYPYQPLGRTTAWKCGFLERLWISNKRTRERQAHDIVDALAAMLDHPSCRFLRELTVGIVTYEDNSYDKIAKVIGERTLSTLRSLILGDFYSEETELNWSHMGDLSPMYPAMPALRSLTLRSGSMQIGAIDLPHLETLEIITGGLDIGSLASICAASWPALTSLSIQLGAEDSFTLAHLAPILDGRRFPKVTHLGLGNSLISDDICRGLAGSAIAQQLVSLDLSNGTLGDEGARALASGSFPKLETIDVDKSFLTDEGIATLRRIAKHVTVGEQDDDGGNPEDRYISARE